MARFHAFGSLKMSVALISIGSNLGNSKENVTVAIKALGKLDDCRMLAFSSFYLTKPWGYKEQPDFINCACKLETGLDPLSLLHCMQKLEQDFHRVRNLKYGPRTLDLDLIAFDDLVMHTKELTLPHPHLHERAFVLVPLCQIAGDFVISQHNKTVNELCSKLTCEQKNEVKICD